MQRVLQLLDYLGRSIKKLRRKGWTIINPSIEQEPDVDKTFRQYLCSTPSKRVVLILYLIESISRSELVNLEVVAYLTMRESWKINVGPRMEIHFQPVLYQRLGKELRLKQE